MMDIKYYRHKSLFVKAIQYNGYNGSDIVNWSKGSITETYILVDPNGSFSGAKYLQLHQLSGEKIANIGDWIIQNEDNTYSILSKELLDKYYDPVDAIKNIHTQSMIYERCESKENGTIYRHIGYKRDDDMYESKDGRILVNITIQE